MYQVLVRSTTGTLLAADTTVPSAGPGEEVLSFDGDLPTGLLSWDPASRQLVVIAATPAAPVAPARLSKLAFRQRWTLAERVAIKAASRTDDTVAVLEDDFAAAGDIDLTDAHLAAGVDVMLDACVAAGVVATADRAARRTALLTVGA